MEQYFPGETRAIMPPGRIDKYCNEQTEFVITQLNVTDESDAIELVDLIKTILTTTEKTEKRMVQLCAIDAIGVHAQIVGELTDKKTAWVYTELCCCDHLTRWEPMIESPSQSSLDSLRVCRTSPRLVTVLSTQPITALKSMYPSKKILFGNFNRQQVDHKPRVKQQPSSRYERRSQRKYAHKSESTKKAIKSAVG